MSRGCADETERGIPDLSELIKLKIIPPISIDNNSMKTLRMNKIRLALKKGYSPIPQQFTYKFLMKRLNDERKELLAELVKDEIDKTPEKIEKYRALFEIADMLNLLEYIYRKLEKDMTPYR